MMRKEVINRLADYETIRDELVENVIGEVVKEKERSYGFTFEEWEEYELRLYHSLRKLDIIESLIEDEEVTEIMINGPHHIFYEKEGKIYPFEKSFESKERLREIIDQIVGEHNRRVNTKMPIVDTRLEDGSRVNVVLDPICLEGPVVTIRKFSKAVIGMDNLIKMGTLTVEAAEFLRQAVRNRETLLITGGTGSGKTTLLNALSEEISKEQRVITIEDSAELKLMAIPNLVRMECRDENEEGKNAITIRDLIKTALRMRPDRLIIGEVRGAEALDLMQALNTGHQGSLSTLHANSCKDAISRLETMILMAMDLPMKAIRSQIASGVQYIVSLAKNEKGKRTLNQIVKVAGIRNGEVVLKVLFERQNNDLIRVEETI
ncbi:MAG: Flp pilus assembly complex ATPase component TadA [Lachnospiraceae bacterium]|nr:Flp pilus assembly complex ATPase component TadA [Lachnospiraceae bacterium]